MKKKRGISPLLASVLLVALAITMAALVSNFVIKKTKEFDPSKLAEQSTFCESVTLGYMINAAPGVFRVYNDEDDVLHPGNKLAKDVFLLSPLTLINRGSFSIHQIIINSPGLESITLPLILPDDGPLRPGTDKSKSQYILGIQIRDPALNLDSEIKIVPIIKDLEKSTDDKPVFVKCTERQLVINYKQLCKDANPKKYKVQNPPGENDPPCYTK